MQQEQKYTDTKMVLIDSLEIHPATGIFPMMGQQELQDLAHDIAKGMKNPIVLDAAGRVIDGRNRIEACKILGRLVLEARTCYLDTEESIERFVISENLHRRHLTEAQRADIAARLANGTHGGCRVKAPIGALTQAKAAEKLDVSKRSVQRVKYVQIHGAPELQAAVKEGEVSVAAAAAVATMPPEEQLELLTAGPAAVKAKATEVRTKKPAPSTDSNGTVAGAEKKYDKSVKRLLQTYESLPDEYRKQVVRGMAEKSPILDWLQAPTEAATFDTPDTAA